MPSERELHELLRLIDLTREREIDCDACLERIAEFAEIELAGRSLSESLRRVEQHLAVCAECREEYELLRRALRGIDR